MKNLLKILAVFLILVSTSCTQEGLIDSPIESKKSSNSTQDIFAREAGAVVFSGDVVGSATLHRKKDRMTANIHTKGLTPGDAYTVWFVIFEAPDVFVDVLYAGGGVVGDNGVANFSAHLSEDDISGLHIVPPSTFQGLTDAEHQGVHMVIRSHGPVIPGMEYLQISTFNGGCDTNVCADEADVIFFPI